MVMGEKKLTYMLCTSTVIEPGEDNRPAGAREFDGWDDASDACSDALSRRSSVWDDDEDW